MDLVASAVSAVDQNSPVDGETARLRMYLGNNLDPSHARLGYRVWRDQRVVNRGSVDGEQLQWDQGGPYRRGEYVLQIPAGAIVQCFSSYAGKAQHQYWIGDPTAFPNVRRIAYEEIDSRLEVLRDYLFGEKRQRKEARDLESAVAWLLWMLGLAVMHPSTKRTEDAPDIIASTPNGNMVVVECTIGLLDENNKLSKLMARVESLRTKLIASGNAHVKLLPMIVTALTREEVKGDSQKAHNLHIAVFTREDLHAAVDRTAIPQDSNVWFDEIWSSAQKPSAPHPGM